MAPSSSATTTKGSSSVSQLVRTRLRIVVVGDDPLGGLLLHQVVQVVIEQLEVIEIVCHRLLLSTQMHGQGAAVSMSKVSTFSCRKQLADLGVLQLLRLTVVLPDPVDAQHDDHSQQDEAQMEEPCLFRHEQKPPFSPLRRRGVGGGRLAGKTAMLIAGQCTPHFLFHLVEKKMGRTRKGYAASVRRQKPPTAARLHVQKKRPLLVATLHMCAKLLYGGRREIVPACLR